MPSPTSPDSTVERSTLDSLYLVYGSAYPTQMLQSTAGQGVNTVMTYYHGPENAPLVFSGTDIWDVPAAGLRGTGGLRSGPSVGRVQEHFLRAARRGAQPHAESCRARAADHPATIRVGPAAGRHPPATVRVGPAAGRHLNIPALTLTGAVE